MQEHIDGSSPAPTDKEEDREVCSVGEQGRKDHDLDSWLSRTLHSSQLEAMQDRSVYMEILEKSLPPRQHCQEIPLGV